MIPLLTILLVLAIAAGEIAARIVLSRSDLPVMVPHPILGHCTKPKRYRHYGRTLHFNQFFMRSAEISVKKTDARELRILLVGDSVITPSVNIDQSMIYTSVLQNRLSTTLGRPVFIGNISTAFWGPLNQLAYLRHFGTFDADAVLLILSGHDGVDVATFGKIPAGSAPPRRPPLAMLEIVSRIRLARLRTTQPSPPPTAPQAIDSAVEEVDIHNAAGQAIAAMARLCRDKQIPFVIVLFWGRYELEGGADPGQQVILKTAQAENIELISLEQPLREAASRGEVLYYDHMHPSAAGHDLLGRELESIILKMVGRTQGVDAAVAASSGSGS